jgi:predicted RNA-binding protein with PUA-like domain
MKSDTDKMCHKKTRTDIPMAITVGIIPVVYRMLQAVAFALPLSASTRLHCLNSFQGGQHRSRLVSSPLKWQRRYPIYHHPETTACHLFRSLPMSSSATSSSDRSKDPSNVHHRQQNYYLLKSEPHEFSIQMLQDVGREEWTGVRSMAARKHLSSMKEGDRCFFYHSSCKVPAIVGTCTVARIARPDETAVDPTNVRYYDPKSTSEKNRWLSVLVEFESIYQDTAVTLQELRDQAKTDSLIADMLLLRQSRLSVMPISSEQWEAVTELQTRKGLGDELQPLGDANGRSRVNSRGKNTDKTLKKATSSSASISAIFDVEDPEYCSNPALALSPGIAHAIQSDTVDKITERELGLPGRKHLYTMDDNKILICYYEGKKFVGKDKERMDTLVAAARQQQRVQQQSTKIKGRGKSKVVDKMIYLLLSSNSAICKRNTLPQLISDGIIVQRLPTRS